MSGTEKNLCSQSFRSGIDKSAPNEFACLLPLYIMGSGPTLFLQKRDQIKHLLYASQSSRYYWPVISF